MSQINCTTKTRHYTHLSEVERGQIQAMLKLKIPIKVIAAELGRDPSTIYREIKRHSVEQLDSELRVQKVYFADTAQRLYEKARKNCGCPYKITKVYDLIQEIESLILNRKWSPDAAVGYLARTRRMKDKSITTKTIYNYIHIGLSQVKPIDLHLKVRRKRPHRPPVIREDSRENSIDHRPDYVNDRSEFGHWEIDTVIGNRTKGPALLTLVERKTRHEIILKLKDRTAKSVVEAIDGLEIKYGKSFSYLFKSLTSDNGPEFALTSLIERSVFNNTIKRTKVYYAHPYRAGERGSNENGNALIRRFIPKGRSLVDITEDTIIRIQDWINSLPRRILGYHSSNDLFQFYLNQSA